MFITLCWRRERCGNEMMEGEEKRSGTTPPLMALNHVSRVCRDVKKSLEFYTKVLGFVVIQRPEAFDDFDGAWLFNYGVGIHLVQVRDEDDDSNKFPSDTHHLDPMDNHISFQCQDMNAMEQRLKDSNVKYIKRTVGDDTQTAIDQLFFNDPDGFMVEICNCENLELVPAEGADRICLPCDRHTPPVALPSPTAPADHAST